jgi:hypothetical protein
MFWSERQLQQFAHLFVGRLSDYAVQGADGRYRRVGAPISVEVLKEHLMGSLTMGTYVLDEQNQASFAVYDADQEDGLLILVEVWYGLALDGIPAYLEKSRRGGHLWVFLRRPLAACTLRRWLLPYCPADVEFYPKQDKTQGYGSLIRVPLGIHRRTGKRYPFVFPDRLGNPVVASSVSETVRFFEQAERARVPANLAQVEVPEHRTKATHTSQTKTQHIHQSSGVRTIAEWCASQDPFTVIGQYVRLDSRGMGHCPFGSHHKDGRDTHPSFQVFVPRSSGGICWRCYAGNVSGNVFNFLQSYHGLEARDLWAMLQK